MTAYQLYRHRDIPQLNQLTVYQQNGGFSAFKKAVSEYTPAEVIQLVKDAGLRGRGGAGFPAGVKWSFIPDNRWPHYVVANADESEPGTFKDREILEGNPFQFLEGLMITAYAVKANSAYVYLRGEFWQIAQALDEKIAELKQAGFLGEHLFGTDYQLELHTHLGAGAYICGEETALLDSLEGKLGQPRLRPPFPAVQGLFDSPTVINNVETLTNVPNIIEHGVEWFRSVGTEKSPGVKIFSLSGNVVNPGNYELPLGTTFRELIFEHGGGIPDGKKIKVIMPAGASSSLISATEEALDTPMDYEAVQQNLGSPLGSASVIIVDDSVNIAWLTERTTSFFKHESCGKCTPCREGTYWMSKLTSHINAGTATLADIQLLDDVAGQIQGNCLCALGEFSTMAVRSGLKKFRADFEAAIHVEQEGRS
jgi:NADH-quinone oxidoreductase subunit F